MDHITYIDTQEQIEQVADQLSSVKRCAVDLEFDRNRYRYGFNLCLIQIYDGNKTWLLDPLADIRLDPVYRCFEEPELELVVYSFSEDIRLLHSLNCFPKNISDLDHALRILNYPPASLSKHLELTTGVELPPSSQQSNWFKRPLTEKQQVYAAADVIYLLDLKDHLKEELKQENKLSWFEQENQWMEQQDHSDIDHSVLFRDKDRKGLSELEWHLYKAMMRKIDTTAEQLNRPVHHIAPKKYVAAVARNPNLLNEWPNKRSVFYKARNSGYARELKDLVEEARSEAAAQGLSKDKPASRRWTREEHQEHKEKRQKINRVKKTTLGPVQDAINEELGAHAQTFILPNGLVEEIILSRADLPEYKSALIREFSRKLDLDISMLELN